MRETRLAYNVLVGGLAEGPGGLIPPDKRGLLLAVDVVIAEETASRARTTIYGRQAAQNAASAEDLSALIVEFNAAEHGAELERLCLLVQAAKQAS